MTAGEAATTLAGLPTSGTHSPFAVAMFDRDPGVPGLDTLYLADDQVVPDGGIQKWVLSGSTWTLAATLNVASGSVGFRGLAGIASPVGVTLMASTGAAS